MKYFRIAPLLALLAFAGCGRNDGSGVSEQADSSAAANQTQMPEPAASTAGSRFQEGVHYRELKPAQAKSTATEKAEVIEFFWYGCPHCFDFEPYITDWADARNPEDATFVRIHATWRPQIRPHARAYFAADELGVLDRLHQTIFDAIHVDGQALGSEDELAEFFSKHGIDDDEFRDVYNSPEIDARMEHAQELAQRYGVTNVPTVVVNGRYVSSSGMAGGHENLIAVVRELLSAEQ